MIPTLIQDVKRTASLKHETSKRIRISPDTIAEHRLKTSPLDKCHEAVDRYFRYVNKHTISEQQRDLIHTATNAMAKTFYGDLFEANMPAILKRNGWVESKCAPIVRGLSGRRVGKSWAMKIMIAALMIAKPGAFPFIFAPSLRQSQLLLDLVERDLLEYAPEVFARIHKKLGQIEIKFGPGRVSKCIAAPASGKVRHQPKGKLSSLWSLSGPPPRRNKINQKPRSVCDLNCLPAATLRSLPSVVRSAQGFPRGLFANSIRHVRTNEFMAILLQGDGWMRFCDETDLRGVAPKRIVILKPVSPDFFKRVICPMLLMEGVELFENVFTKSA